MSRIYRFAIIGPESTGKSTLARLLADHFQGEWAPEYAREYLTTHGKEYTIKDLQQIALGQLALEDSRENHLRDSVLAGAARPFLFTDTDMQVMRVWSEFVFDACDSLVLNAIVDRTYDGYLLCAPDVPWVKDLLREYPDHATRNKLFHYYLDAMVNQSIPWIMIQGDYAARVDSAISFVNSQIRQSE
ncbi:MAG: AAA family ATPase [Ferruginibacter sp.]